MSSSPNTPTMPEVAGVDHGCAVIDGCRIHVAQAGAGEPVVLLHTFPQDWYAWRHVIPELAEDARVLCPDFRGAGLSEAPRGGYGTRQRAQDVVALLDGLGLERVTLVGHGWGAWAGFRACLDAPERFSCFVALSMTHPWPLRRIAMRHAWRQWHTAFWEYPVLGRNVLRHWPAFTRFALRHWAHDRAALPDDVVRRYAEGVRDPGRARAGQALHWDYVVHDIPRLVFGGEHARLTVPTHILIGDRDPVIRPAMARGGEAHADDLVVTVVPGAGHLLPEERPGVVAAAVREMAGVRRRAPQ